MSVVNNGEKVLTMPIVLQSCRLANPPSKGQVRSLQAKKGHFLLWGQVPIRSRVSGWIHGRKLPPFLHGLNARSSAGKRSVDSLFTGYPEEVAVLSSLTATSWLIG